MRRTMGYAPATLAIAAALTLAPPAADAQPRICGEHAFFQDKLEQQFQERRSGFGVTVDGRLLELFVGPSGSWTILVTVPGGPTCVITDGGDWQETEPRKEEPLA